MLFLVGDELDVVQQKQSGGRAAARTSRAPVEKVQQKANVVRTPSLKDTLDKINAIGSDNDNEIAGEKKTSNEYSNTNAVLTQDDITTHYGVFLDKIKKQQPRLYSSLKNQQPVLNENGSVYLYFQNNAVLEEFKHRLKPSLVSHYRNNLNGAHVEIIEQMHDSEKVAAPKFMNDREKFEEMSEKNPALKKLKNLFNLDFD